MSTNANKGRTVMCQGRIVWVKGDLFKGQPKTDYNTKQPVMDTKTGSQKIEWGFGLAIPKSVLQQTGAGQPGEIWAALHEEAFTLFPSRQIPPLFAMKFKDGDGVDDKGVPFANREGYAGSIVLACTTNLRPRFFKYENGQHFEVTEGIKCGDYINVQLNIKAHPAVGTSRAGLYVNPNMIQFLGYGKEIINRPDASTVFGSAAPSLPPGASAMPMAPATLPGAMMQQPQGAPTYGQQQPAGAVYGQPPMQPQMQTPPPVDPHYGILPPQHQPAGNVYQGAPAVTATTPQFQAPTYAQSAPVAPGSAPIPPQFRG